MGHTTSVKVLDKQGRPAKAEVICGGVSQGFTDDKTGEIHFDMYSADKYEVYAKRYGDTVKGEVRGGQLIVLRI